MQKISDIDPLLHQNPRLGCIFILSEKTNLLEKVYDQIYTKSLDLFTALDKQQQANAEEMVLIANNIINIKSNFFSAFESILKPSDYSLVLFQFFLNFIEDKVNLYKTNDPDDRDFEHKWNDFKREIAFLRYDRDKNLYLSVENFLNYLNQKLESIDELKTKAEQENGIWAAWKQIFATPDALEFHVAELACKVHKMVQKNQTFVGIKLSPPQLAKACGQMIKRVSNDLPWLFDELRNILSPLTSLKPHPILNNSKYLLGYLENHYIKFLKGFEQFHLEYLDLKNKDYTTKAGLFYESINQFCGIEGSMLNDGFGDISKTIKYNEIIEKYIEIEKIKNHHPDDHLYDLNDYFNKPIGNNWIENMLGSYEAKMTLDQFKAYNACLRSIQKCHILIDTYLASPMNNIMEIINSFTLWSLKELTFDYFKKSYQNEKSIKELAAEIEGIPSPKTKKNRRNRNQKPPKALPLKKEVEKPKLKPATLSAEITQEKLQTIQAPLTKAAELSSAITHLFSCDLSPYPKAALRQALMYANDLQVIQNHSLGNATEVISTSYYLMEQLLRYLILTQDNSNPALFCEMHNLKALIKELPKEQLGDPSIAKTLYLGNYWASYPFEQNANWSQLSQQNVPQPLKEIYAAATGLTQSHSLQNYAEKTIDFSKLLMGPSSPLSNQIIPYNSFQFDLKKLNICIGQCEKAVSNLNIRSHHPALNVLKQACYGFNILKGIFETINSQGLRSDTLSFFVRRAIYWQSHVLESLMRVISLLQSGLDIEKHDLVKGYQQINWTKKSNDLDLIQKEWAGVSKFSRYPFESPQAIHDTHRLILKGELLRECPEWGLGFLPQNKGVSTSLNFIDISAEGLKADEILIELEALCGRALTFIEQQALPQIEKELNGYLPK